MNLEELRLDLDGAEEGIWFPFGEDCDIRIARWGNKSHQKVLKKLDEKHGRKIRAGAINDETARQIMQEQWPSIVKDWRGLYLKGEDLNYSPDAVRDLARNPQYEAFFARIERIAKAEENYRVENIAEMGED